jgi:hypothetical protein
MSESAPQAPNPRQFFEDTKASSKWRNAPLVAIELNGNMEAARLYLQGYQEELAELVQGKAFENLSESNREPVRMARSAIEDAAYTMAYRLHHTIPAQEGIDAQLGVWKQIFEDEATGA